jgi:tetratricopeptide (TPR) repeat protein
MNRAGLWCAIIALAVYSNSLYGEFVMDDTVAIIKNEDLRPTTELRQLFINDFWGSPVASEDSHKSYRPLTVLTYRLNYSFHQLDVFGYHLVNVVLHGICTYAIACLGHKVFASEKSEGAGENAPVAWASWVVGLSFATHPVHTEAIASVVGRAEPLSALPYILALYIYIIPSDRSIFRSLLVCGLATVSMLCKETGFMALPICLVLELCDLIMGYSGAVFWAFSRCSIFVAYTAGILFARMKITTTSFGPTFSDVDNYIHYVEDDLSRAMTYMNLHWRYLMQLVYPRYLSCDWSYIAFPIVESVWDKKNVCAVLMYAAALYAFIVLGLLRKNRTMVMSCLFSVVPFIPASNLFFPVATVLAERVLYLPSIGFSFFLALLYKEGPRNKCFGQAIFVGLLALYCAKVIERNDDWSTPVKLFTSATKVVPQSCKAWVCLASAHKDVGENELAKKYVNESLSIKRDFAGAHFLLGNIERAAGNTDLAIASFESTVKFSLETEFKPDVLRVALNNLGAIFLNKKKNYAQAIHALEEGMKIAPNNYALNANLGEAYAKVKEWKKAIKHYKRARKTKEDANLLNNLAIAIYEKNVKLGGKSRGDQVLKKVRTLYEQVVALEPSHYSGHLNIGKICYRDKEYTKAIFHLERVIKGKPGDLHALDLLGRSYMQRKKYKLAVFTLEKAKKIAVEGDPFYKRIIGNLKAARSVFKSQEN